MEENKPMKEFSNRIMKIVNQIRLLREAFQDQKIVEKFESKISPLEETKVLT